MKDIFITLIIMGIFLTVYHFFIHFYITKKQYHISALHRFGAILFSFAIVTSFICAPISLSNGFSTDSVLSRLYLIPFHGILSLFSYGKVLSILHYAASCIVLLFPLGFFLPLLWKPYRNWIKVTLFGFLISLLMEIRQLFINHKADINDILLNVLGVFLGFILYALLKALLPSMAKAAYIRHRRKAKHALIVELEPVIIITAAYLIVLIS